MAIRLNKNVALRVLFVLCQNIQLGMMYQHEKPIAEKIWKEPCQLHDRLLNDCNWCWCHKESKRFTCDARVCNEVDMFGHFNDAIREIDVGMEGHGVWRTNRTPCQPEVSYQRGELLCVCNDDGNWPNPTCRDTFRILHPVEIVKNVKTFKEESCTPMKLYLIGCNVCYCPETGVPNPKYCTRNSCVKDDPVFEKPKDIEEMTEVNEVYAQCDLNKKYKFGCKNCVCLRNNRLLCDNCTDAESHCSGKEPGKPFNDGCNTCQCDDKGLLYCTVKRCIHENAQNNISNFKLRSVETPFNDLDCIPGTKYSKDCNTCYCFKQHNIKSFGCTLKRCSLSEPLRDCVVGTTYKMDCLKCYCGFINHKKMQICEQDPECSKSTNRALMRISDLPGYCEPSRLYLKDCNTCECLPDGKTVKCTAHHCKKAETQMTKEPMWVDLIPVVKDIGECTKGGSFKINCNICFCLSNGNVLCTTKNCDDNV